MSKQAKITIVTGHSGVGKSNFSVNLALALSDNKDKQGNKVAVADLDIVNPYFRTSDFAELFGERGIHLVGSQMFRTNMDIPAINLNIAGVLSEYPQLIIDVGGDEAGSKVLGRFAEEIELFGYEMIYVINKYRYHTESAEQAAEILRGIEAASNLKGTGVLNNSHLCGETTPAVIAESSEFAEEVARLTGLPLIVPGFPVEVYVKPPWRV